MPRDDCLALKEKWLRQGFPVEDVACPVCQQLPRVTIAHEDRYGIPCKIRLCHECGLLYLSPRPTRGAYEIFYEDFYRPLVSSYWKMEINKDSIRKEQAQYGCYILDQLPMTPKWPKILDAGGSTGEVATVLSDMLDGDATVLDPCVEELCEAQHKTICSNIEDAELPQDHYDLIVCARTIDHMLDPKKGLEVLRDALKPGGILYVDFVDIEYIMQTEGASEAFHLDHPCNFDCFSAYFLLGKVGLSVLQEVIMPTRINVGFVCTKPKPRGVSQWGGKDWGWIRALQARDDTGTHPLRPKLW